MSLIRSEGENMTENGYKLAQWLYGHRDNMLVLVLYASLFIFFILAVEIATYSDDPPPQKMELHLGNDHQSSYRR